MNKRTRISEEKHHSHSYKYERFDPPLKIQSAITSRWRPGDLFSYDRKKVMSINLVTMGNGEYEQNGNHGVVWPGEVFLAHKGATQRFFTGRSGFLHKRTILIEGTMLDPFLRTTGLIDRDCIRPVDRAAMTRLFRETFRVMRDKPDRFTSILSSLGYEILTELARSIAPEYPAPVQSAIEFMKRNLHRSLDLATIAGSSGLSVRHFSRLFNLQTGFSPMVFFTNQKMDLAETLLLNTALPIKQVAAALGYEDPFHFSLQFKKQAGESPLHFRQRAERQ